MQQEEKEEKNAVGIGVGEAGGGLVGGEDGTVYFSAQFARSSNVGWERAALSRFSPR